MNISCGIIASPGVVKGTAVVMTSPDDITKMSAGAILVLKKSDPSYAECVMKASALICETGGKLTHICVVALEMGIPAIVQVEEATRQVHTGDTIYLNTYDKKIEICE